MLLIASRKSSGIDASASSTQRAEFVTRHLVFFVASAVDLLAPGLGRFRICLGAKLWKYRNPHATWHGRTTGLGGTRVRPCRIKRVGCLRPCAREAGNESLLLRLDRIIRWTEHDARIGSHAATSPTKRSATRGRAGREMPERMAESRQWPCCTHTTPGSFTSSSTEYAFSNYNSSTPRRHLSYSESTSSSLYRAAGTHGHSARRESSR
jgi:hypothetical protein